MEHLSPSSLRGSFQRYVFTSALLALLLCGCERNQWQYLHVEKENRPVTLEWVANGPTLQRVHFISESLGWGVGFDGSLWHTVDGGKNWAHQFIDNDLSVLRIQFLPDGKRGWITASQNDHSDSVLLTTSNGGDKWEPMNRGPKTLWTLLWFYSDSSGCIGDKKAIQCTTNGGLNWSTKPAPPNSLWAGLHFLSNGLHGWAWTDNREETNPTERVAVLHNQPGQSHLLTTNDGGHTWTELGQPIDSRVLKLDFLNEKQGWALTNNRRSNLTFYEKDAQSTFLRTEDGGATWHPLATNLDGGLTDFRFADVNRGWAVGTANTQITELSRGYVGYPVLLYTNNGGHSWSPQNSPLVISLIDVELLPGSTEVWVLGRAGALMHTRDGTQWSALTKITEQDLTTIRFASDGRNGWARGSKGTILHTPDSGVTWQTQYRPPSTVSMFEVGDLQIDPNGQSGWAMSSSKSCPGKKVELTSTENGGNNWKSNCVDTPHFVEKVYLTPKSKGWAVATESPPDQRFRTSPKYLLFTSDRGQSWSIQHQFQIDDYPTAAYFTSDGEKGWVFTQQGRLLRTQNGGGNWTDLPVEFFKDKDYDISVLHFLPNGHGWAAGTDGDLNNVLLHTADNGDTWAAQNAGGLSEHEIAAIDFLSDGLRGWATATEGTIFYTSDAGEHWQTTIGVGGVDSELLFAHFTTDEQGVRGWVVGRNGTILRSTGAKLHPIVTQVQVQSSTTSVELKWRLADDTVLLKGKLEDLKWQIEYCSHKQCSPKDWQELLHLSSLSPDRSSGSPVFSCSWNPADSGIGPGTDIHYRIAVYDGAQWITPQELGAFTYQPLWGRLSTYQKAIVIGVAVLLAYVCACFILLWLHPRTLLWMNEHLSVRDLIEPWAPDTVKAVLPTTLALVPWFAKHSRVNQAWNKRYLSQANLRISDLSPSIRKHYVTQEATLDAWVTKHRTAAQNLFLQLDTVKQRSRHIFMPVRLETEEKNILLDQLSPKDFRPLTQLPRLFLSVVGIGGSGKSSLACQLARSAMNSVAEERLAAHTMIPVLIEEDTDNLISCIKKPLLIVAGDDLPDELLENLLAKKRLLVMVDALSEKSQAMQDHVRDIYSKWPVNALVITTRRTIDVIGANSVLLRPEEITVDGLAYFLLEYLRKVEKAHLFPGRKAVDLISRLLLIAEEDGENFPLTPLLIVLFVKEAITLAEQGQDLDSLPVSIPETMITYLKRLNENKRLPEEHLIKATLAVAKYSLAENYNPHEFEREKAITALKEKGLWTDAYDVLKELADCGILEQRESAGTTLYRFRFDPVAEYMAAIERVRTLNDSKGAWEQWLNTVREIDGYPRIMDGFLTALQICVSTYQKQFNLPIIQISENDQPQPIPSSKPDVVIRSIN